jgi:hypothetical protein
MGLLTDKEIEERLASDANLANRLSVHQIKRDKHPNTPNEIKKIITILSNEGEQSKELASVFQISKRSVDEYRAGETSKLPNPELKQIKKEILDRVSSGRMQAEELAIQTVLTALNILPDKIQDIKKPKQLASIAKDMAILANQMADRDRDVNGDKKTVHLHLYAPQQKKIEDYDIIDVGG